MFISVTQRFDNNTSDFSLTKHIIQNILLVYSFLGLMKMSINNTIKLSKLKSKCKFLDVWLEKKSYKLCLEKSKFPYNAFCNLCVKDINLSTMGCGAIDSHAESIKHQIK